MGEEDNVAKPVGPIARLSGSIAKGARKRAVAAIGKLMGAYGSEVLDNAQASKDARDARSTIASAVADAAAKQAAANPEIVDRMLTRFYAEEFTKQANREKIAEKATEHLDSDGFADASDAPISDDWMNVFADYAEKASSENLQDLWASILAGEIRKPGEFSLWTLQFVAALDQQSAMTIERAVSWVVNESWILEDCMTEDMTLEEVMFLEEIGFCSGTNSHLRGELRPNDEGTLGIRMADTGLVVDYDVETLVLKIVPLSRRGREISQIIKVKPKILSLIELLKRDEKVKRIDRGKVLEIGMDGRFAVINSQTIYERTNADNSTS